MEANATTDAPKKRGRPKGSKNKSNALPGGVQIMSKDEWELEKVTKQAPPRLGTHDAAKDLIRLIAKQYPDAGPMEWRQVLATLNAAARHPKLWIELTRGEK